MLKYYVILFETILQSMDYIQMYIALTHGHGIKDYLDMQETMIMSILELLENKR